MNVGARSPRRDKWWKRILFADEKRMEKERGGEKERQTSALESMRMSEGSERRRMTEGRRERWSGSERVGKGGTWPRKEGAREQDGFDPVERERSGSAREPITRGGSRGVHEGPGYSAHARRAWERALTFRQCPLFLFRSIRPALLRVPSLLLSPSRTAAAPLFFPRARSACSLAPGPNSSLPLSLSLSPCPIAGVWARIPDHGRARTIQGPAGTELFVQGCSISG